MTISYGVITFSVPHTGNIGVGDIVLVNSVSYMIVGRTSTPVENGFFHRCVRIFIPNRCSKQHLKLLVVNLY